MAKNYTSRMEKRQQRKSGKKSLWKKFLLGFCIAFVLIMITGVVSVAVMIHDAPKLSDDNLQFPQSTRIYDEDGEQIDTLFHEENRINVSIDEVPEEVRNAVLSIEDKRFYDHKGIDFHRLIGAAVSNVKNGWGAEGGSTLTQQVIKRTVLSPEKTLKRKVQEAWLARKLEKKYSKEEILELYLNNVYFGHGAYGIKTASVTYFGEEDLSKLNVSQIALLAGLPNSPSATDPFKHPEKAEERRNKVLAAMESNGIITEEEGAEAKEQAIGDIVSDEENEQKNDNHYNAYVDAVYEQLVEKEEVVSDEEFFRGGLRIYTHLDTDAQKSAYDLLHSEDIAYPDDNFEAGFSLVDTETGAVKAVGGGRNFQAIGYTNYGSQVAHQPGSTIKPILDYAPAIEHLKWSTSHVLSDEPYEYSNGSPINEWDGEYWGDVTIRRALEWSRNIPALKAFQAVGEDKAQEFASGLGIDIDPIYESAAIGGSADVSPLQLAAGYATFGNGGTYNEPSTVKKIVYPDGKEWEPDLESETAMHDYTAYMITDMLKTVMTTGTGTQANIDGLPLAGKTGSTNIRKEDRDQYGIDDGLRDSWFSGYTTEYSLSVWTGYPSLKNEDGDVQYIKYDGTQDIAKQLFREMMSTVSSDDTADFIQPESVVASGSELFVRDESSPPPPEENQSEPPQEEQQEEPEEEESDDEQDAEDEEESDDEANDDQDENDEDNAENDQGNNNEEESNDENQDSNDQNNDQNQNNGQNDNNQQDDENNQDDGNDGGDGEDGQNNDSDGGGNDEGENNQDGNGGNGENDGNNQG